MLEIFLDHKQRPRKQFQS